MSNYNLQYETDDDSVEYSNEIDSETEFDIIYQHEENSFSKYNLVLCEKYNQYIHGSINGEVNYHYLTHIKFKYIDMNIINYYINNNTMCKLEIAECLYLETGHCISILKTFWLKIIQRTWKKICKDRKNITKKRSNLKALFHREICGKWPENCIQYPYLRGMLSNLT
jgi:hypothetical protein